MTLMRMIIMMMGVIMTKIVGRMTMSITVKVMMMTKTFLSGCL